MTISVPVPLTSPSAVVCFINVTLDALCATLNKRHNKFQFNFFLGTIPG